jgi:hypothetical protein
MWTHYIGETNGCSVFIWRDSFFDEHLICRMEQYFEQGQKAIGWIKEYYPQLLLFEAEPNRQVYGDACGRVQLGFHPSHRSISVVLHDKALETLFKLTFV